jgi:signal transduction histidine kinase
MRWSIRYQLLVPLLTLLFGVVVGITAWSAVAAVRREQSQIEAQVRSVARTLHRERWQLTRTVLHLTKELSGAEYLLVSPTGTLKETTLDAETHEQVDAEIRNRLDLDNVTDDPDRLTLETPVTVAGRRFLGGGLRFTEKPNRGDILYILYPESLWLDALWGALVPSLILGSLGGILSVLVAITLAERLSRRIRQLGRRTHQIASGDFSPMPLPERNDELRDLTESVNEMAARLSRLQDAIQQTERLRLLGQVSGGLAHQLRNGVTGARLAVQLHARECAGSDAEPLQVALRQLDLVEANLKRFLDLGRADEPRRQPCALTALVGEAVMLLHPQCKHARIELRWEPADEIRISADPGQIGHLLHNVLGNAVEAAGPGGSVEVRAHADDAAGRAVVEVRDSGPGPAPAVAGRLFEPFVTGKPEGIGLGLAVARRVAEAHGGTLVWTREAEHTCFRMELPLDTIENSQLRHERDESVSVP